MKEKKSHNRELGDKNTKGGIEDEVIFVYYSSSYNGVLVINWELIKVEI